MPEPIITLSLLALGMGAIGGRMSAGGGPTPPSDGRWVFPVAAWRGYAPTRSQEYRAGDHNGNDIMFRRVAGGADQQWPSGGGDGTGNCGNAKWFHPRNRFAYAARDGVLWHVGKGGHGRFIVIDHGAPFASFYTHLSSYFFPELVRGAGGIVVKAGQPLGVIGFSPLDASKLIHLHFEIWHKGGAQSHIDPWPILQSAPLPEDKQ